MSSASEAELGSLSMNARKGVEVRNILEEKGHPQPPTRQLNRRWNYQLAHDPETHKGHGHAIPLAARSGSQPTPIQILLAAGGGSQQRRLLDETSFPRPSQQHKK
jgi:hypothetical protein